MITNKIQLLENIFKSYTFFIIVNIDLYNSKLLKLFHNSSFFFLKKNGIANISLEKLLSFLSY